VIFCPVKSCHIKTTILYTKCVFMKNIYVRTFTESDKDTIRPAKRSLTKEGNVIFPIP
jgi:hypothetical protein